MFFSKLMAAMANRSRAKALRELAEFAAKCEQSEAGLRALSDADLEKRARGCRDAVRGLFERAGSLESFSRRPFSRADEVVEVFAVAREAGRRLLGMRYFDVQLSGGLALHEGEIAEMRTGEGKTLVITLPAILNALAGVPVHVVTVNDYLARRDKERMEPLYSFFGLSTGLLWDDMEKAQKPGVYGCDIVYGVNHGFGFDYLRENMVLSRSERVMRGLGFAIIDEVDSILVDEARTPLIISGEDGDDTGLYSRVYSMMDRLRKGEFEIDLKAKQAMLTEPGFIRVEDLLVEGGVITRKSHLYESESAHIMRVVQACLNARFTLKRDKDYVVMEDGAIAIVDEFTGRLMPDRRWSNGIHQALEAKEGVAVRHETKTLASITYQNFFRLYEKKAGLTGTAMTQEAEFAEIYGMRVVSIPTNMPMIRTDHPDVIYRSAKEKFDALADEISVAHMRGQPVLAGTSSIRDSEELSGLLEKRRIPHNVLNAKNHEREALTIAAAGRVGAVTVATNMAGRGTDIILGGIPEGRDQEEWTDEHEKVKGLGGLYVLGSARHESRRIDNQLRGRAGRQGDPGMTRFILSLDDDLFRAYARNGVLAMIDRHNMMPSGSSLEHPFLSKSLDRAQATVEFQHFAARKQILEYDDVAAEQRKAIYSWRNEILDSGDCRPLAESLISKAVSNLCEAHVRPESIYEEWDVPGLDAMVEAEFGVRMSIASWADASTDAQDLTSRVAGGLLSAYLSARASLGPCAKDAERSAILVELDEFWQAHLTEMGHLMEGIHLRAYAQKDPKREYKADAFAMFGQMLDGMALAATGSLMRLGSGEPFADGERTDCVSSDGAASDMPKAAVDAVD